MNTYQLIRLRRGKAMSLAPIMMGRRKVPQNVGDRRNEEKPDHDHAVQGEKLVIGRGGKVLAVGMHQLDAHQQRSHTSDEEEKGDRNEIEQRDAFVVVSQQPGGERLLLIEIILLREEDGLQGFQS